MEKETLAEFSKGLFLHALMPKTDFMAEEFTALVCDIPDFPKEGVLFRDITPLLEERWSDVVTAMLGLFSEEELAQIDGFVGIESRGFGLAGAMADRLGKGNILARKAGKLPGEVVTASYDLEYGSAELEMKPGKGKVIIVDDLLATGGTLMAAIELSEKAGYEIVGVATLIDLMNLNDFEYKGMRCRSVIHYDEKGYKPQQSKTSQKLSQ